MSWAIRVPFEDSWLYVTEDSIDGPCVKIYNTREEAKSAAVIWKIYEVVEYKERENVND